MTFTGADITSLTAKLVDLDLTDPEREALRTVAALVVAATTDTSSEVAGFSYEAITLERGVADFRPLLAGIGRPSVWKAPAGTE